PRIDGLSRIEPLDEPSRLVWFVPAVEVLADEPERLARVEVERDPGERAAGLGRLLLEERQPVVLVELDRVVAADRLEIADVVDAEHRSALCRGELAERRQALAEEVVAGQDDQVVVDTRL